MLRLGIVAATPRRPVPEQSAPAEAVEPDLELSVAPEISTILNFHMVPDLPVMDALLRQSLLLLLATAAAAVHLQIAKCLSQLSPLLRVSWCWEVLW